MTTREQTLFHLLDLAITYIQNIADKDSPTLNYLLTEYEELSHDPTTTTNPCARGNT